MLFNFRRYEGLSTRQTASGGKRRVGSITKAGNSRLRNLLIESSWHYRHYSVSKRLTMRRKGQSPQAIDYANKAGKRLSKKFMKLVSRGKNPQKTVTAVARELSGFIWGMINGKTALI